MRDSSFAPRGGGVVGAELEWLTTSGPNRGHVDLDDLSVVLDAPDRPVPASRLTVEPGGQLELSSRPSPDLRLLCSELGADTRLVADRLQRSGVALVGCGRDPVRTPRRILDTPRYRAMAAYFDGDGPAGATMMCSTAAVQVNVDHGAAGAPDRWRLAHLLGPALAAAFANSPLAGGQPTGWCSGRLATWWAIDPSRTSPVPASLSGPDAWVEYALAARVMLVRVSADRYVVPGGRLTFGSWMADGHELGYPTEADLDYHLTTLFPPVRPRGWLELRYLDALPDPWWAVAVVVAAALLEDEAAGEAALEGGGGNGQGLWYEAARSALSHPLLAASAKACFEAVLGALGRLGVDDLTASLVADYHDRYVARGRCPADDRLDEWVRSGEAFPAALALEPSWS